MKRSHLITLAILFVVSALALSACGGDALIPSGWSGISSDTDTIYLAANQFVYAIDMQDGTQTWRYPDKAQGNKTFFAAPELSDDDQLLAGSYDHSLYSLDPAARGAQNWSILTRNKIVGSPLATAEWIYLPATDNKLYQFDLNGNPGWVFQARGPLWSQPVAGSECDCIYLSSMDHYVYALEADTGELIWEADLGTSVINSPALGADGQLFATTLGGDVVALDALSGSETWRKTFSKFWAGPALDDDTVYVAELAGVVHALQASSGAEKWSQTTDGRITGTPAVSSSGVYVTTETGYLYSLDKNGKVLSSQNLADFDGNADEKSRKVYKIYSSPYLVINESGEVAMVLVAPQKADYQLLALGPDGTEMWRFIPPK